MKRKVLLKVSILNMFETIKDCSHINQKLAIAEPALLQTRVVVLYVKLHTVPGKNYTKPRP